MKTLQRESTIAKRALKSSVRKTVKAYDTLDKACIAAQKELVLEFLLATKSFARKNSLPFSFQILDTKAFQSGFDTDKLANMLINPRTNGQPVRLGDITPVLGKRTENDKFPEHIYYVYCKKKKKSKAQLPEELAKAWKDFIDKHADAIDRAFFSQNQNQISKRASDSSATSVDGTEK